MDTTPQTDWLGRPVTPHTFSQAPTGNGCVTCGVANAYHR